MPHFFLFDFQIELVKRVSVDNDRHSFAYGDAIAGKPHTFGRIISDQTNAGQAQVGKDLSSDTIITQIRSKAQLNIGFNGIITLILQRISPDFIRQTDTTSFLTHIQYYTAPFFFYHSQRCCQLIAAITAQGTESVAGQTF